MKRKSFLTLALVGLLAVGFAGTAFANDAVATALHTRFSCDEIPGEAITLSGSVANHDWNRFELTTSEGTTYLVKTGPAKLGRSLEQDLDGMNVTVAGYTGPGTNYKAELDETVSIVRAQTITLVDGTVIDLTQVETGGFGQGTGGQAQARSGGRGGNSGNGTGVCPR
jgi:hypothetical protein